MITRRRLLVSAAAAPLALAGCKVRTINYFPVNPATVRFVNVIYPSAGLDGLQGANVIWTGIGFQGTTDYVEFDNTETTFTVRTTGTQTELGTATISLTGRQPYTLVAFGALDATGVLLLSEAVSAGTGNMLIRLINVGLGTSATDVFVTAPDVDLETVAPNFSGVGSGGSTVGLRMSPGTYRLRATFSGTRLVIYDSGPIEFAANTSTNLLLYTLLSASLLQGMLLPVNEPGASAFVATSSVSAVKVVNAAFNAGTIDGFVDGALFVDNVPYGAATGYAFETVGPHTLSFEATSTAGAAIATLQQTLESTSDISVLVVGLPGAVQAIAFADNNRAPIAAQSRVRFVNGGSDNVAYDVYLGDTKLVNALGARTASFYFPISSGTYTITFRDPSSGATMLTIADQAIGEGRVVTFYLAGVAGQLSSIVSDDR